MALNDGHFIKGKIAPIEWTQYKGEMVTTNTVLRKGKMTHEREWFDDTVKNIPRGHAYIIGNGPSRKNFNLDVTTSYKVYKNRTKSSFELLDSIQGDNIYRVYPHTLFCDTTIKNRCVTHDDKNIFYFDDDHPSLKGAEIINDLIMKEIKKIELRSN